MILPRPLLSIAALALAGCTFSAPEDAVSVEEVIENIHDWDDRQVAVVGWLGECGGYDCGLYQSLEDARMVEQGDPRTEAWLEAINRRLSIGYDEYFDFRAWFLQHEEVIIEGRINADCSQEGTFCFDRADDIRPSSITKLL